MASSSIRETMKKVATEVLMSYETATKTKDGNSISQHLAPECRRELAPLSMLRAVNLIDIPNFSFSNADYQAEYEKHMPIWWVTSTEIRNLTVDVEDKKAAARVVYKGEFIDGEKMDMEFAWFLDFNESGTEVTRLVEFVDTPDSLKHWNKAKELEAEHEAKLKGDEKETAKG